jgi:hypothetical protein
MTRSSKLSFSFRFSDQSSDHLNLYSCLRVTEKVSYPQQQVRVSQEIKGLLVHILVLRRPVSLHHSHFNAGFHAHATYNVLRHRGRVQDCWKHCIMKLVVNLHKASMKMEIFI